MKYFGTYGIGVKTKYYQNKNNLSLMIIKGGYHEYYRSKYVKTN